MKRYEIVAGTLRRIESLDAVEVKRFVCDHGQRWAILHCVWKASPGRWVTVRGYTTPESQIPDFSVLEEFRNEAKAIEAARWLHELSDKEKAS